MNFPGKGPADRTEWSGLEVGFLVIGATDGGASRAAAVAATPGARLVAVCDADSDAARRVARRYGAEAFANASPAIHRSDVDAVIVATPNCAHYREVRSALEAGKHVLCEIPLTIQPDEVLAAAEELLQTESAS